MISKVMDKMPLLERHSEDKSCKVPKKCLQILHSDLQMPLWVKLHLLLERIMK